MNLWYILGKQSDIMAFMTHPYLYQCWSCHVQPSKQPDAFTSNINPLGLSWFLDLYFYVATLAVLVSSIAINLYI